MAVAETGGPSAARRPARRASATGAGAGRRRRSSTMAVTPTAALSSTAVAVVPRTPMVPMSTNAAR